MTAATPADAGNDLGLAMQAHRAGRLDAAEAIYRNVIDRDPGNGDALHLLGVVHAQRGDHQASVELIRRAVAIRPESDRLSNLGNALRELNRPEEALSAFDAAVALNPANGTAHNNRGTVLKGLGRWDDALAAYLRALKLDPDFPLAYSNLGNALQDMGELESAVAAYRAALDRNPNFAPAHANLGNALRRLGRVEEAVAAYCTSLERGGPTPLTYSNLGNALETLGDADGAMAAYDAALALDPRCAEAHWNASLLRLRQGDFARGWEGYEWRWRTPRQPPRGFPQPLWQGEDLDGRTLLLHAEQGLGDTLHFVRYAPLVARGNGTVILEVQRPLLRLLGTLDGVGRIVARGDPLPPFDLHCPLLSLPRAFGTRLETIPAAVPYLRADPALEASWRTRLSPDSRFPKNHLKVGLVWAGHAPTTDVDAIAVDRRRSLRLSQLAPLARVPGVCFYSLQKDGEAAAQARTPPAGMTLVDAMDAVTDFADTAALVAQLDLVIGVDTSVIHLAGALGRPVWVLSRFDACWRWLENRDDSPWYPTLRLFRQERPGDWSAPLDRLAQALAAFAAESAG